MTTNKSKEEEKERPTHHKPFFYIAWLLGVASAFGAIGTIIVTWETYGWITRSAYADDQHTNKELHEAMPSQKTMADILTALGDINTSIIMNRDEWRCDEIYEEVPDIREKLLSSDLSVSDRIDLEHDLKIKDEIWDELKCSQFMN